VYGLGAVLYALLTGRPPFQGQDVLDTLLQVRDREPEPPGKLNRRVSRDLETVCLKCLEKDPSRRYASAEELADDLERWLSGEPITARPAGRAERVWKWARRYPAAAALILALLVGAAGSMAGAWLALLQRDRAVRAEGEAQGRLAQSHADAARLAMQRGQW